MTDRGLVQDIYPLTPMQQGMLFHALYAPDSGVYVQQVEARLKGDLDPTRFRRAWQALVDRHPVLRTGFEWERRADPFQVVYREATLPWHEDDWSGATGAEQSRRLDVFLAADRAEGFALHRAPLMRAALVRLAHDRWQLVWTHHHLILDGWSVPLLLQDLFALYRDGHADALERRRPFRDHVAFVRGQDPDAAQRFWTAELAGVAAPRLPSRSPAESRGFAGALEHASIRLDEDETSALAAFARERGLTVSTIAQGAWAIVLGAFSGGDEALFASTVGGRSASLDGAERMVGLFINTLPVRVELPRDRTTSDWLAALQARLARQRDFEQTPLVEILGWSGLGPFDSLFVFENYPVDPAVADGVPGLAIESADAREQTNFPLTLVAVPGRELLLRLDYDAGRFDAGAAAGLLDAMRSALAQLRQSADRPLGTVTVSASADTAFAVDRWNDTARVWPDDRLVHEMIDAQAARDPEAIAVRDASGTIAFGPLARRAGAVAAGLAARGVSLERRVGIALPRSIDLVVSLVGAMKAGAAYVPLDPAHPPARLQWLAADAALDLVVGDDRVRGALDGGVPVVSLDELERGAVDRALPRVPPEALAYVLYTSGSTGAPKGAMVTHRGLANYVRWAADAYDAASGAGSLLHSPLGFDLTVTSLFPPLAAGRPIQIVADGERLDALATALHGSPGWSLVKITPAHLDGLRDLLPPSEAAGATRAFVIGGEALSHDALAFWRRHAPRTRLVNEYGPTETVVGCAVYDAAADDGAHGPVPIGRPIANARLYVLDRALNSAPIGSPGELYIGGDGVARGYQGRPDLTAERFLPDPFSPGGARMYRSGDLARQRADGVLEFLGRTDDQLKVRGFRIEPGEIEAALLAHAAVREAAVVARATASGDPQLAAFVVAGPEADAASLRRFLRGRLPEHLVPATVESIDRLPLTPNGKIDRRSLAERATGEGAPRAFDPPRGPVEGMVAAIWCDVLGRDRISRDDSFFDLGGHSLVATRLVARLRKAFAEDVPLKDVFEAPTIAGLAARIDARGGAAPPPAIEPRPLGEPPVLSFAQQRLWFLHELDPDSAAYLVPAALRVDGALDVDALRHALRAVVDRHEALRTRIETIDGRPVVSIADSLEAPLRVLDLSARTDADRDVELERLIALETRRPFDLTRPPLLRAMLARLTERRHVLLLTMHHLVSDAWSMDVLVRDLAAAYEAARQSRPMPLPPLRVQYADVARWQRARLSGDQAAPLVGYWRSRLDGVPPLELPADRPRTATPRLDGASVSLPIDHEAADALVRLARAEHATPFMAFLAAFELLLARSSGQRDFAVGTPIAARAHRETEHLIGFFMNTLALRSDVDGAGSFLDLLRRVRRTTLDAYAHQDLPFERLVDLVHPSRDPGHNPVAQTMFTVQHQSGAALDLPGLRFTPIAVETSTSKFDVSLSIADTGEGWLATFEYRTDLFDAATVQRMARRYARLVASCAREPERPLDAVSMLDEGERGRAVLAGHGPVAAGDAPLVHAAFEARTAETPDALALVADTASLTFDRLNRLANRFARRLVGLGVGPDVLVALRLERSVDFVVAMLAVLKAGGAYVPIDPSYPPERVSMMMEDAGQPIVVSSGSLAEPLPADDSNLEARALAEATAYVIFTSGSTGRPKGVMIPHRALANHMRWMQRAFPLAAADRVLQKTPASFDASVWEFHAPLMAGATLVLARPGGHQDPDYLVRAMAEQSITIVQAVPSLLRLLLDAGGFADATTIRRVFVGGEALTADLQRRFAGVSDAELINLYGPTEATIDSVVWTCRRDETGERVPIGAPIENLSAHVLDARLEPLPDGAVGELFLGGAGVGRGYLRRPDLTAERFVPDPFAESAGAVLYRTGDLVRRRPAGELEYLGRADHQVKLRGFRVELGEVQCVVESHAGVRQAAVVMRAGASRQQLVAYVVARDGGSLDAPALRAFVRSRLPEYMVPSTFVELDRLPTLPSGKIDRRALPDPPAAIGDEGAYLAPRSERESALASIWADVLGAARVGVRDNFFALGGDSILSLQVVARARKAGLALTPAQMFTHQTIEALAAAASDSPAAAPSAAAPGPSGDVPLTPVQRWFFERPLHARHHWNQAMLLKTPPGIDRGALEQAVGDLVAHHDALRFRFRSGPGGWRQDEGPAVVPAVEVIDVCAFASMSEALDSQVARLHASIDLATPPLLRVAWFDDGAGRPGRLLLLAHHLVVDGVSWRVLVDDLRIAYDERRSGRAPALEASTPFRDWADRIAALAASPSLDEERAFWHRQLDATATALPVEFADALDANTEGSARHVDRTLAADRTDALLREVAPVYHTQVGDLLIASLVDALAPWTGRRALVVELEGHGRDAVGLDVSRTIGWFTTLYPVRLDASGVVDPGGLIRTVKEQLRAVPRRGVGYGLIRYGAADETAARDLAAHPEPALSFNYLGQWPSGSAGPFGAAPEEAGPMRHADARRTHLIEIVAGVVDGRLRVRWTYSERLHRHETVAGLADAYQRTLDRLIDHCLDAGAGGHTPSDFSAADLDQRNLDKLLAKLRGS